MKTQNSIRRHARSWMLIVLASLVALACAQSQNLHAQGTAFTYQGRLDDGGAPANGHYDFEFHLYTVASGGAPFVGGGSFFAHPVSNGLFTVTLDFQNAFPGADRWLEIAVKTNGGLSTVRFSVRALPHGKSDDLLLLVSFEDVAEGEKPTGKPADQAAGKLENESRTQSRLQRQRAHS